MTVRAASRALSLLLFLAALGTATAGHTQQTGRKPTCEDLIWSAQVLAANPDIKASCQGVYQRGDELYARVEIELTRVRGNRLTFRPQHVDGGQGTVRSIVVPSSWRAEIDNKEYRARDLLPGQRLSVFIPEDRFALALGEDTLTADDDDVELLEIEDAAVVTRMPKTASPLAATLASGMALLGLGLLLRARRQRTGPTRGAP